MSPSATALLLLLLLVTVAAPAAGNCRGKRCQRDRKWKPEDGAFTSLPGVQSCTNLQQRSTKDSFVLVVSKSKCRS